MRGLLADVNVQGHAIYLRRMLDTLGLWTVLDELGLKWTTFSELQLPRDLDDRALWNDCQEHGWALLTENRNSEGENSLQATLDDAWQDGHLPVLTLANKRRFESSREYAERLATDVAEVLFGIAFQQYRDQPRLFIPLTPWR